MAVRTRTAAALGALILALGGLALPATAASEGTGTVTGVITLDGEAFVDARVAFHPWGGPSEDDDTYVYTDATGRYELEGIPAGPVYLSVDGLVLDATKSGTVQAPVHRTFPGDTVRMVDRIVPELLAGETLEVDIAAVPAAGVTGRVVDVSGKPVTNTVVHVANSNRAGAFWVKTDATGRYTAPAVAAGPVEISVLLTSRPRTTVRAKVTTVAGSTVTAPTIKLKGAGRIDAKVSGLKKNEVVGVYNVRTGETVATLKVKKAGSVRLKETVEPGKYRIVVRGLNSRSSTFTVRDARTTKVPALKVTGPRTTITGITRGADGKPVAGVEVEAFDNQGSYFAKAVSDGKGRYVIKRVRAGTYHVRAQHYGRTDGGKATSIKVKRGTAARQNLRLAKGYRISGTVTSNGKPLEDVYLAATTEAPPYASFVSTSRTDAKGRFVLHALGKGTYRVSTYDLYPGGFKHLTKRVRLKGHTEWSPRLGS